MALKDYAKFKKNKNQNYIEFDNIETIDPSGENQFSRAEEARQIF